MVLAFYRLFYQYHDIFSFHHISTSDHHAITVAVGFISVAYFNSLSIHFKPACYVSTFSEVGLLVFVPLQYASVPASQSFEVAHIFISNCVVCVFFSSYAPTCNKRRFM